MTSTYQTAVLVQYNDNDTLSLDELIAATNLPKDTMLQILSVLVKAKILINEEQDQYDLNPSRCSSSPLGFSQTERKSYSTDFKSKKIRVNLNQPIKAEVKAEQSEVLKSVDEDRKYVIQATIVR
jgi:cullin 1